MLHHAQLDTKGGNRSFAAICSNGRFWPKQNGKPSLPPDEIKGLRENIWTEVSHLRGYRESRKALRLVQEFQATRTAGSRMRTSAMEPERMRLDGFVQTGVDQTKSRVNSTTETKNCVQFPRQMPEARYNLRKRLDWGSKQPQHAGEAFCLGNVGLGGEPNHATNTDHPGRLLDVDRRLRRGCSADV